MTGLLIQLGFVGVMIACVAVGLWPIAAVMLAGGIVWTVFDIDREVKRERAKG